jgi:hypothetical protein
MNRYAIFGGDYYYPNGGWDDLREDFETVEQAQTYVREELVTVIWGGDMRDQWWHIIDLNTGLKVAESLPS